MFQKFIYIILICFGCYFFVFAWKEPARFMPNNYNKPIHTSSSPDPVQYKNGELSATKFLGYFNQNLYLDPDKNTKLDKLKVTGKIKIKNYNAVEELPSCNFLLENNICLVLTSRSLYVCKNNIWQILL